MYTNKYKITQNEQTVQKFKQKNKRMIHKYKETPTMININIQRKSKDGTWFIEIKKILNQSSHTNTKRNPRWNNDKQIQKKKTETIEWYTKSKKALR